LYILVRHIRFFAGKDTDKQKFKNYFLREGVILKGMTPFFNTSGRLIPV